MARLEIGQSYYVDILAKKAIDDLGPVGDSRSSLVRFIVRNDSDEDGLPDDLESTMCTDPNDADTDDDGIKDGDEDTNHNGVVDPGETDPCNVFSLP